MKDDIIVNFIYSRVGYADDIIFICLIFLYICSVLYAYNSQSFERCEKCGKIVAGTVWTNSDNDNAGLGWIL